MHRIARVFFLVIVALILSGMAQEMECQTVESRCEFWLDLYRGEPVYYEDMLEDLATVRVVYLGERHTLPHHHDLQEQIIVSLLEDGSELAVGLEMLPAELQPVLDEYNAGNLTFEEMAEQTAWEDHWSNYEQYRGPIEAAHKAGAPILALNAHRDVVREVALNGLAGLDSTMLKRVPGQIDTDQPEYQRELSKVMMVMAHVTGHEGMMQCMFEAQVVRDETMADGVTRFLESAEGEGRKMVVLCGGGHVSYGYGIPSRVRARLPDVSDRIVIFSESGDVVLSEREKAMSRPIEITHAQVRENGAPYADYLHARSLAPDEEESDTEEPE
jgi:uncharacterized iron-regulated protein